MKNWKEIHEDFGKSWGEDLKKNWKSNGFDYNQTKVWINSIVLTPKEYDFAWWIVNKQNQTLEHLDSDKIKELRKRLKNEWKEISPNWDIEAQKGITAWIKKGFTQQEVKQWKEVGLTLEESDLAIYLKQKNYNPLTVNPEEARKEYNEINGVNAQEWLDDNFPQEKRTIIKKLDIGRKNLRDSLELEGFTNLEELHCYDNQLSSLDCSNCPQLKIVRCQKNNLTNLNLAGCLNLTELYCNRNQLTDLNFLNEISSEKLEVLLIANNNFSEINLKPFSEFTNLKNLGLGNWSKESNNHFIDSLEPLKNLTKLEDLDIAGTDIIGGLEHLPNTIQVFYCSTNERLEAKAEIIAKKLRKYSEIYKDDDGDENFARPLQVWREFLDSPAQQWLDEKYPLEERTDISFLDISKKNLKGALKLKGFAKLRTFCCSDNQLTNLNLSDCQNLTTLKCSNNNLCNLYFLKTLNKLKDLTIKNNLKLSSQNLKYLASLKELIKLNISDCPLEGSLKTLEKLDKLELLTISNTNIEEGLEWLPTSCKKLYCSSNYKCKSIKIVKELDKSKCSQEDENDKRYYDLDKWREDKQNSAISVVVPLERFFVIRSNIKKFVDKWGMKHEEKEEKKSDSHRYSNYSQQISNKLDKFFTKQEEGGNSTELSKLQSPEQYERNWYWSVPQWTGRGAVGISGILGVSGNLSFAGHEVGAIAIASPVIETITSYAKKNWYEDKEKRWEEFTQDSKELLDNYHELLGILSTIRTGELGQLNNVLKRLKKTTEDFLNEYDTDNNGVINIFELKENKNKKRLADDLNKENKWPGGSKLERIVRLMKILEEKINDYFQEKLSEEASLNNKKQELAWTIIDRLAEYSDSELDVEKEYNAKCKQAIGWKDGGWEDYLKEIEENDFIQAQENLLYALIEIVLERLKSTKVQELLSDQKKNQHELTKFVQKIEDLYEVCRELKNEKLNEAIVPLKSKINEFSKYLSEHVTDDKTTRDDMKIEIEEEKRLEKIIELIRDLEEGMKDYHETFTNKNKNGEEEKSREINQEDTVIHLEENEQGNLEEKEVIQETQIEQLPK